MFVRPRFACALLLSVACLGATSASSGATFVSVTIAPPALPVYVQPVAPAPGFLWTPGYWAWGSDGYYWVPGTWVRAPYVGALWTPGYWGWGGAAYLWHPGYWGPRVGFYGGVNYGFGYFGAGYLGGYWNRGVFNYNTAVTNVNVTNIHNTYNRTVEQPPVSRVAYNGGAGGISAQPSAEERLAERDAHREATPMQAKHEQLASTNRSLLASVNHGSPTLAATPRATMYRPLNAGPGKVSGANDHALVAGAHPNRDLETARGNRIAGGQQMHPQRRGQDMARPQGQFHQGRGGEALHEEGRRR